ncbi:hypothetical protein [Pediococcus pentosaceus]|uniref:hypothetical protein n=1 Tax=Pediococcus pentosaceus TaxID=1255 RepID=UPI000258B751|nr:hypothetical protein [Pediococcus pentosaceus]CCG90628.1 hypothetical protein PCPN_1254 [Pediococcus pentosaceus IE-3]
MNGLDQALIHEYIFINKKIDRIKRALGYAKKMFNNQSFIGSSLAYTDEGATPIRPPRIEDAVISFVDLEQLYSQTIIILEFKKYQFRKFVRNLSVEQCTQLMNNNMEQKLEVKVMNEIRQIEEACGHRFGLYVEEAIEQPINNEDVLSTMEQVLGMSV